VHILRLSYNQRMNNAVLTVLPETQQEALKNLGVVLLYVHGSVATGSARKDSDVDIAVLFDHTPADSVEATAGIVAALHGFEKEREMDVSILNEASPLLNQTVASQGKLLYARLPDDALLFEMRAMHEYEYSRQVVRLGQELALQYKYKNTRAYD